VGQVQDRIAGTDPGHGERLKLIIFHGADNVAKNFTGMTMFRISREERIQKVLADYADKYDLSENSRKTLNELTEWLRRMKEESREEWPHEDFFELLLGEQEFDKELAIKEVLDKLRTFQEFVITLVDKLAMFHASLSDEQKSRIREEFGKRGTRRRRWQNRRRRHRPVA